jgi:hypothetical protein
MLCVIVVVERDMQQAVPCGSSLMLLPAGISKGNLTPTHTVTNRGCTHHRFPWFC